MSEVPWPPRRWRRGLLILVLGGLGWTLVVCYPNPLVLVRNLSRYRRLPLDPKIAWSMGWTVPEDPARIEQFVDALITTAPDWQTYRVPWYMPAAWEVARDLQGDCESKTVLLASLLAGQHIPFEVRASFDHIWVDYAGRPERPGESRSLAYLEGKEGRLRLRRPTAVELKDTLLIQKQVLWDAMPAFRKQTLLAGLLWVFLLALTMTASRPLLEIRSRCRRAVAYYVVWGSGAMAAVLAVMAFGLPGLRGQPGGWSIPQAREAVVAAIVTGGLLAWLRWVGLGARLLGVKLGDDEVIVFRQRGPLRRAAHLPAADIRHLQLNAPSGGLRPWPIFAVLRTGRAQPLLCQNSEVAARRVLRQLGARLGRPIVVRSGRTEMEIAPSNIGRSLVARAGKLERPVLAEKPKAVDLTVTQGEGLWRLGYPETGRSLRLMLLALALMPAALCVFITWLVTRFPRSLLLWTCWMLVAAFLTMVAYLVIVLREEMVARLAGARIEIAGGEMCVRAADGAVHRMALTDVEGVELGERGHANVLVVVCFDRVLRIGGFGSSEELRWAQAVLSEAIADAGLPAAAGEASDAAPPPSSLPLPTSGEGAGG
jgi:hypothetical protein